MGGASDYVKDRWNVMDFFMNSLYLATISTKICAYMKHMGLSEGFGLNETAQIYLPRFLVSQLSLVRLGCP